MPKKTQIYPAKMKKREREKKKRKKERRENFREENVCVEEGERKKENLCVR